MRYVSIHEIATYDTTIEEDKKTLLSGGRGVEFMSLRNIAPNLRIEDKTSKFISLYSLLNSSEVKDWRSVDEAVIQALHTVWYHIVLLYYC